MSCPTTILLADTLSRCGKILSKLYNVPESRCKSSEESPLVPLMIISEPFKRILLVLCQEAI